MCIVRWYKQYNGNVYMTDTGTLYGIVVHPCRPIRESAGRGLRRSPIGRDGAARAFTCCGSAAYIAPEVLLAAPPPHGAGYDHAADLWALGVVLHVVVTGAEPFPGDTDSEVGRDTRWRIIPFFFFGVNPLSLQNLHFLS